MRTHRPLAKGYRPNDRRGVVLIIAIVAVVVASVILTSTLKLGLARRRALRTEQWRVQADWLAESGLERAAWRLAEDAGYSGETWKVPAAALGGSDGAVVTIQVEPQAKQPARRLVRIQADYPNHPRHRVRRNKQAVVALRQQGESR